MDRHRDLYKDNFTRNSPKIQRLNRERLAIRSKQRNDQFHATRKISVSPTPHVIKIVAEENKENCVCEVDAPSSAASSRIAKVACKAVGEKLTRQELALQRFINWKNEKKAQMALKKQQKHLQKKPFVSAARAGNTEALAAGPLTNAASSFILKKHKFTAPAGLKNPAEPMKPTHISNAKQRQSLYTIAATPEKKKKESVVKLRKHSSARKVFLENHVKTPGYLLSGTTTDTKMKTIAKTEQQKTPSDPNALTTTANEQQTKALSTATTLLKKTTAGPPNATAPIKPEVQRFVKPKLPPPPPSTTAPAAKGTARIVKPIRGGGGVGPPAIAATKPEVQRFVKPIPLILPPPPPSTTAPKVKSSARIVKPIHGGDDVGKSGSVGAVGGGSGAVGKAKAVANFTTKGKHKHKHTDVVTKSKLAVSMKAKAKISAATGDNKKLPAKIKLKKQTLLEMADQTNQSIAETPNDVHNNINPFGMFVTSTMRKSPSNSQSTLEFLTLDINKSDTISPVESLQKVTNRKSAAKRQLIQDKVGETVANQLNTGVDKSCKSKFNFVRYSEVLSEIGGDQTALPLVEHQEILAQNDLKMELLEQKPVEVENKETAALSPDEKAEISTLPRIPTGVENGEQPINYLSPFVSVARGKVNSKTEKEKRNSMYLQGINAESGSLALQEKEKETHEALVVMLRTGETVRYFRKQLKDETERLHAICDKWEAYKTDNLTLLQETGGDDMINATIGQTKLLTSKKFMQFSGLIDRCEQAATAPHLLVNDGSEKSKLITAIDLEGFWSMVGLQIENVEKRFDNLERWRTNNWLDPDDDVKPIVQQPKQLAKAKKPKTTLPASAAIAKAKPSSALQQMLRKMHADMRKNKAAAAAVANEVEPEVVQTPTGKRRSHSGITPQRFSSPLRQFSIIVQDRKVHSVAPTILTINTPNRRTSLRNLTSSPHQQKNSPKLLKDLHDIRRSAKHTRKPCGERNDLRMSVLKGAEQERRMSVMATPQLGLNTPQSVAKGRKSILKTPGTAKGKPKNVNFNEELRIKKFKFIIDSDQSGDEADEEEAKKMSACNEQEEIADDTETRTYSLRTRKVLLRPSGDFEIPK